MDLTNRASVFSYTGNNLYGDLNMTGNKVVSLGTPTEGEDGTNKSYVDSRVVDGSGIQLTDDLAFKSLNINAGTLGSNNLVVNGTTRLNGNLSLSGGNRSITNTSNNALSFGTNNIERMTITNAGKFGIGTDNPIQTSGLMIRRSTDVTGGMENYPLTIYNPGMVNNTTRTGIAFHTGGGNNKSHPTASIETLRTFNGAGGALIFKTNIVDDDNTERMRINRFGNIGINETSPTERLHVSGNILATGTISGASKEFVIDHPNPSKKNTHKLIHTAIETNTQGTCFYEFNAYVEESYILSLPSYFKYLICDDSVKCHITPIDELCMVCYKKIDNQNIQIRTSSPCNVSILVSGVRKDEKAIELWKGDEVEKKPVINEVQESEYNH
jgi:hypothetical protein